MIIGARFNFAPVFSWPLAAIVAAALAATACTRPTDQTPLADAEGSHPFAGTWNAAGTRHTIPLGNGRSCSVVNLKGTMLIAGPGRPGAGFLAEAVALNDSTSGLVGRSVWTDEHGDQVYSELTGEGTAAKNRVAGTIVGGTGRYAGATGTYGFSWEYVIQAEDGAIQGRAVELSGEVRVGAGEGAARP